AASAAREATRIQEVLLRTMSLLLGTLAGCDRAGLELELTVLGSQPELHLRATRLFADRGHLPGEIGLEAGEIEAGAGVSRSGGEALVERLHRRRIDAVPEDDPLLRVEAAGNGNRHRTGDRPPAFFERAQAAVEQLVVAVEPRLQIPQPEVVREGLEVHAAQAAKLRLHAGPQLLRRERQGAAEETLEIDAELPDVAVEAVEVLGEAGEL